jgi:hypothetical protein
MVLDHGTVTLCHSLVTMSTDILGAKVVDDDPGRHVWGVTTQGLLTNYTCALRREPAECTVHKKIKIKKNPLKILKHNR